MERGNTSDALYRQAYRAAYVQALAHVDAYLTGEPSLTFSADAKQRFRLQYAEAAACDHLRTLAASRGETIDISRYLRADGVPEQ